eukprot:224177-Chlamydomonas_euryale.AAC.2
MDFERACGLGDAGCGVHLGLGAVPLDLDLLSCVCEGPLTPWKRKVSGSRLSGLGSQGSKDYGLEILRVRVSRDSRLKGFYDKGMGSLEEGARMNVSNSTC